MARVVTYPEAETPDGLRRQVRALQEEAWPSGDVDGPVHPGPVHDPSLTPLSMLLVDGDTVLASLDVLFKRFAHSGDELSAAGLSTVVTASALRRQGYGRILVTAARAAMTGLDVDLGIFTCDRLLGPFYESCGWEILPGTVIVGGTAERPFASDQEGFDKVTLGAFFTTKGMQSRAALLNARVLLHPGDIDKLW